MNTQSTITFEQVNGYLVRLYDREVESDTKIKYKSVLTIEINGDVAVAKGCCGEINHRNISDIQVELKSRGVKTWTWERYDSDGKLRSTKTGKIQ